MYKAILFDLDGTLLNIDMNEFLKYYFQKMISMAFEAGYQDSHRLMEEVYKSTEVMIADRNPLKTNEEVFMNDFFGSWPYTREQFAPFFDRFYEQGFPTLHKHCAPFAGVPEMLEKLLNKGFKIIIATNAVFPRTAMEQRLKWAGISDYQFELITSYEVMHYCKPHLEYYHEICERVGVIPRECLMVGNDVGEDVIAGKLGMKTFLVENLLIDNGQPLTADWRGTLDELYEFMDSLKNI